MSCTVIANFQCTIARDGTANDRMSVDFTTVNSSYITKCFTDSSVGCPTYDVKRVIFGSGHFYGIEHWTESESVACEYLDAKNRKMAFADAKCSEEGPKGKADKFDAEEGPECVHDDSSSGLSSGAAAGLAVAITAIVAFGVAVILKCRQRRKQKPKSPRGVERKNPFAEYNQATQSA